MTTRLEMIDANIQAGQVGYDRLEVKMKALKETAEAEPDQLERATHYAELCGIVYGLLFLKLEIAQMRQLREYLIESGRAQEVVPDPSETNDSTVGDDMEAKLRELMG